MTTEQRKLFGITDELWRIAKSVASEAMVGGRAKYLDLRGNHPELRGKIGTIHKVVKSTREIELRFDSGQTFRAFAHNVSLC